MSGGRSTQERLVIYLAAFPRPHPDFSPQLRDKIWVGPGDEVVSEPDPRKIEKEGLVDRLG